MFKKLIFVIVPLMFSMFGCSSTPRTPVSITPFEKIYEFSGIKKSQLFDESKKWALDAFMKADTYNVVGFADENTGIISGKYIYPAYDSGKLWYVDKVRCVLKIEVKDEKCRLTISAVEVHQTDSDVKETLWRAIYIDDIPKMRFQETCEKISKDYEEYLKNDSSKW